MLSLRPLILLVIAAFAAIALADAPSQSDQQERPTKVSQSATAQRKERTPHPELARVFQRLQEMFKKSCPSAKLGYEDNGEHLVGEYRTRDFQTYIIYKNGKIAQQPHTERGPEYDGFLLRVAMQSGEYHGPAVIPQALGRPYWTTYINAVRLEEGERYLWVQLSYGVRTDRDLLKAIKIAVGVPANSPTVNASQPNGMEPDE